MHSFKRLPTLPPSCSHCSRRPLSTTVTATRKRRKARAEQKALDDTLQTRASTLRTRIHDSRLARREDWILGPLAPRRDLGDGQYGTIGKSELKGVTGGLAQGVLTQRDRGGVTAAGALGKKGVGMSWEENMICVGDRVAVVGGRGPEGRDKGRIGVVREVRREARDVLVNGVNMADINTNTVTADDPDNPVLHRVTLPIPLSSVRLVQALRDPITGIATDKIISRLIPLPPEKKAELQAEFDAGKIDKAELERRMRSRTIPGSKDVYGYWLEIPTPQPKTPFRSRKVFDSDTLRFEVEEKTWTPTLLRAPMPDGVIDELRNKYSRLRTRHEPAYQRALDARARRREAYKAWVKTAGNMLLSPAKEAQMAEKRALKAKGEPTLEREVLERIGEVMASKGIEMTGKRRKEVTRNLGGVRRVVKWGEGVGVGRDGGGVGAGAVGDAVEDEVVEEEEEDQEEYDDEEGEITADENVASEEEQKPRGAEKRPTL